MSSVLYIMTMFRLPEDMNRIYCNTINQLEEAQDHKLTVPESQISITAEHPTFEELQDSSDAILIDWDVVWPEE
jgi:hypothetical protein